MLVSLLLVIACLKGTDSQTKLVSPCPRLFRYEAGHDPSEGKWFGVITLLGDTNLNGIWLRIILDRPSLQLGNWFGEVTTTDNKEFLIKNRKFALEAHVPAMVRFYIKYDPDKPIPQLMSFRLNAKTVCPEMLSEGVTPELQTSATSAAYKPTPNPVPPRNGDATTERPGGFDANKPSDSDDDNYFQGDFHQLFSRPTSEEAMDLNAECGTVTVQPSSNAGAGNTQSTKEGLFPWHAALYYTKGIDLSYICAGTLISKYHVISAAHCVTRRLSQTPLNPENLVIYLAKYYLKRFSNVGIQDKQATLIIPHPNYNPQTFSSDIAIVKFSESAEITNYVRPICLWQESRDLNSILNKYGSVVGWGFDQNGKITEHLVQTKMSVVSPEACTFQEASVRFRSSDTYCAGFRNGTLICNGDSGASMVFPRTNPSTKNIVWQLRGVIKISTALQSKFKCDTSEHVVFTDVASYLDWIKETVMK